MPLVPKLAVTTPGAGVAGADRAHHVVAAAGADENAGLAGPVLGGGRLQHAGRLVAGNQRRHLVGQAGVNGVAARRRPLALADIEQRGAAGVAELHHAFSPVSQKFR